jgi:N,N-dimethylformamidase
MWSWIFAGEGECFGRGPALVLGHGAAGFEIDRTDVTAGTPEQTVALASADQFTDAYQTAIERATAIAPWYGGSDRAFGPARRYDGYAGTQRRRCLYDRVNLPHLDAPFQ